ncbi:hypothetical protein GF312_22560 [Candidatus Poribacteria bacterium]|nr:hypothetical protein [Candidatus Poribacteria bacterium]
MTKYESLLVSNSKISSTGIERLIIESLKRMLNEKNSKEKNFPDDLDADMVDVVLNMEI